MNYIRISECGTKAHRPPYVLLMFLGETGQEHKKAKWLSEEALQMAMKR